MAPLLGVGLTELSIAQIQKNSVYVKSGDFVLH